MVISLLSILINYVKRFNPNSIISKIMQIITLGYAIPGPVVAIAVLIPFATLDNFLNQILISTFNYDVGLLLVELFLF